LTLVTGVATSSASHDLASYSHSRSLTEASRAAFRERKIDWADRSKRLGSAPCTGMAYYEAKSGCQTGLFFDFPFHFVQPQVAMRQVAASVLGPEDRQNFSPGRKVRVHVHIESKTLKG
jgi:hypothetical protein